MMTHAPTQAEAANETFVLRGLLGVRLVAYIAGVTQTRVVHEWADGLGPGPDDLTRARVATALELVKELGPSHAPSVIQAWFQGANPDLGDRAPARVLREARNQEALILERPLLADAARAFDADSPT